MGLFNMLVVPDPDKCANCGLDTFRHIQFNFGEQRSKPYSLGDRLSWGGIGQGKPGLGHVAVYGVNIGCPNCGYDDSQEFRVEIRRDVIDSVQPDDGRIDYLSQGNYYWVVLED